MTRDELEKRNVGEILTPAATVSAAFCTRAAAPIPVNL